LSDIYTENARPHSAQVLLTLPYAEPTIVQRELLQLMQGISAVLNDERCALIGGHTAEGSELQVGLVVNAEYALPPETDDQGDSSPAATSYALILTQPLGVGVLFAGLMQAKTKGIDIHHVLTYLLQSNATAARSCATHGMQNCTDITGFGLLGHLSRMQMPIPMHCKLNVAEVAFFPGVDVLIDQGIESSLSGANQTVLRNVQGADKLSYRERVLLTDPQTAGGLLAVVPIDQATPCVQALHSDGYLDAAVIGSLSPSTPAIPRNETQAAPHSVTIELVID